MSEEHDLLAAEVMDPRHGPGSPGYQKLVKALIEAAEMVFKVVDEQECPYVMGKIRAALAALKEGK